MEKASGENPGESCDHRCYLKGAWGMLEIRPKEGGRGEMEIYAAWSEDSVSVDINYCPFCGKKLSQLQTQQSN